MDIYIPNIKLPKDEPGAFQVIVMYVGADGKLRAECEGTHEVTAVPPHGRLIDADEFFEALTMDDRVSILEAMHVKSILSEAPTIIPAEEATP